MKKILVTGAIASGKSEVCRYLASKGIPVYNSDSRAKALYDSVPGLKERIEKETGISFDDLGIIFRDSGKRKALEAIVHPLVREDFEKWSEKTDAGAVAFESALALSSDVFSGLFDETILVKAPVETRLQRNVKVSERNNLQSFDESKADFILVNDSDIETLHKNIDKIL